MKKDTCSPIRKIFLDSSPDSPISERDSELLRQHLSQCEVCRTEYEVYSMLQTDSKESEASTSDELLKRRVIDGALNGVSDLERTQKGLPTLRILIAASIVVVLVGTWLAISNLGAGSHSSAHPKRASAQPLRGQIVLSAGHTTLNGQPARLMPIAGKSKLEVNKGLAVVRLETGILLHLEEKTILEFTKFDNDRIDLFLVRGHLFADVDPGRSGPPLSVTTSHGQVRVTGTVFCVNAVSDRTTVNVFRGSVESSDISGKSHRVESGKSLILGKSPVGSFQDETPIQSIDALTLLELFRGEQGVHFGVQSNPVGAMIKMDGVETGQTPMTAAFAKGDYEVELTANGYETFTDQVSIGTENSVDRYYELKKHDPTVTREPLPKSPPQRDKSEEVTDNSPEIPAAEWLLGKARKEWRAGQWSASSETYQELIRFHSNTSTGRAALVSLGQLYLDHLGNPKAALSSFKRYLKVNPNGTLAPEAVLGLAKAYRSLGNIDAERTALNRFLATYPTSIQFDGVRKRLDELK